MEARDTSAKIRLLPPDSPDGSMEPNRPQRQWLGPIAAAAVLVAFAIAVGLSTTSDSGLDAAGDVGGADSPLVDGTTETTTTETEQTAPTTTAAPVALLDQVPGLSRELSIVGSMQNLDGSTNVVTSIWNGRLAAPTPAAPFDRTYVERASFAPGSRMMALLGARQPRAPATLYVGSTNSLSPKFVGVSSYAWIRGDALGIAFTAAPPDAIGSGLYRANVAPSGLLTDVVRVADVSGTTWIAGAGPWGYVINDIGQVPIVTLLDAQGVPQFSAAGSAIDVSADGTILLTNWQQSLDSELEGGAIPEDLGFPTQPLTLNAGDWAIINIDQQELAVPPNIADTLGAQWSVFSPDGTMLVAARPTVGERWSVRTASLDGAIGRTTSVPRAIMLLGWTFDGQYVLFETAEGLAFHNWDRGTTYYVDFEHDYQIIAIGTS